MTKNSFYRKEDGCPFKVHPVSNGMKGAFTLVELLVVIAILCLLFALLFPIVMTSREYAKRVICINNLRQISLSLGTFAGDHALRLPGVYHYQANQYKNDNLSELYPDYTTEFRIFVCPATRNIVEKRSDLKRSAKTRYGRGISFEYKNAKIVTWGQLNASAKNGMSYLLFDTDSRGKNHKIDADDNHVKLKGGHMLLTDGSVHWIRSDEWKAIKKSWVPKP
jgi:prepilin-type N-terminal cleavage/methylation domain-containing protein